MVISDSVCLKPHFTCHPFPGFLISTKNSTMLLACAPTSASSQFPLPVWPVHRPCSFSRCGLFTSAAHVHCHLPSGRFPFHLLLLGLTNLAPSNQAVPHSITLCITAPVFLQARSNHNTSQKGSTSRRLNWNVHPNLSTVWNKRRFLDCKSDFLTPFLGVGNGHVCFKKAQAILV